MSKWSNILSIIEVDTNIQSNNVKGEVEKILAQAPKITGDEENANYYVNVVKGYNTFTTVASCAECSYGERIGADYECHCTEVERCPDAKYQTVVLITIEGNLRNRVWSQVENEFDKFIEFLKDKFFDVKGICTIDDGGVAETFNI